MENNQTDIDTPECLKENWTFIRLLGEGSNGKTYLAKRNRDDQLVAVKVMKFVLAESFKSYELFCREAEVMKSLNIKGVPKTYECQAGDASSLSYIIQEYIEYPSLQRIVKENGPLKEELVLKILEKLAQIIYELQTNYVPPIIHRDIKPSNVLCDLKSDELKVFLIDFGAVANPQKRSNKSTIAGTFGYMAPEQMLNDVVIQSDYYSLGALGLFLLTGKEPYEMETQDDAFNLDYMNAIENDAPDTSHAMISLLGHFLDPVASKRPINAIELVDEIHRVQNGEFSLTKTPEKPENGNLMHRFFTWMKKHSPKPQEVYVPKEKCSNWVKTEGIVRKLLNDYPEKNLNSIEYTFDANGRTWCGISVHNPDKEVLSLQSLCVVRYDPEDPRFNYFDELVV